ncbi:MAG: DUF1064 domain-containing protein [Candidatus Sulfotelmatobacter sp.]
MTPARLRRGAGKFGNVQTAARGKVFASKREAVRYGELSALASAGVIKRLETQVKWELVPRQGKERAVNYVSDFQYFDAEDRLHVEDTKGYKTREYVIKRKLMRWVHGVVIEEI